LLGVYDQALTPVLAEALRNLGSRNAFVVHGEGGVDEISITGPTQVTELRAGKVTTYRISPEDFGIEQAVPSEIKGGDTEYNAAIVRDILDGQKGPKRDMVLLNAGAAFRVADTATDIMAGIAMAKKSIDSGKAMEKLELLVKKTNQ
jgi:anthranilate phosphoribosyltransferase